MVPNAPHKKTRRPQLQTKQLEHPNNIMSEEKEVTTPTPEAEKEEEAPKAEVTEKEEESTATFEPVVGDGYHLTPPQN